MIAVRILGYFFSSQRIVAFIEPAVYPEIDVRDGEGTRHAHSGAARRAPCERRRRSMDSSPIQRRIDPLDEIGLHQSHIAERHRPPLVEVLRDRGGKLPGDFIPPDSWCVWR